VTSDTSEPTVRGTRTLLRGPRTHSVAWMIHDDWIEGTVTCHAAEGADCRLDCPQGCEDWIVSDHEHELIDSGRCLFVEWMHESDGVLDAHRGSHSLTDGFIEPEWDDDHYTWTYSAHVGTPER
jgi:hypothetical protein